MMKSVDDLADDWAIASEALPILPNPLPKTLPQRIFVAMQLAFTVRTLTHRHPLGDIVARFANERRVMRRA